ncbi:hypothetical protein MPER_06557 [Moniliophthora perniciosa FA553]|nr:hypothetical protein MPER_06557 [Moniliophthora perniciosa FA553]
MFLLPPVTASHGGAEAPEGSKDNPIILHGILRSEIEALLWMFYGMGSHLNGDHINGEKLLVILLVADLYHYQPGIDYAIRSLKYSASLNTGLKLVLGLDYNQQEWVRGALQTMYRTGQLRLSQEDIHFIGKDHPIRIMLLSDGGRLFEKTQDRLITAASSLFVRNTEWMSLTHCSEDEHATCLRSVTQSWKGLKERVEQRKRLPDGDGFSLIHFREVLENGLLTPQMKPHCRSIFINDISYRTGVFFDKIVQCIANALFDAEK